MSKPSPPLQRCPQDTARLRCRQVMHADDLIGSSLWYAASTRSSAAHGHGTAERAGEESMPRSRAGSRLVLSLAATALALGVGAATAGSLTQAPYWTVQGDADFALLGWAAAPAGDVNGDGYADVVVGAPGHKVDGLDRGMVRVYLGGPAGLGAMAACRIPGSNSTPESPQFGFAVSSAGDVNGDGFDDVIVGAPFHSDYYREGSAFIYLGSPNGVQPSPAWTTHGTMQLSRYGYSVSAAGDVNGDGFDDVIIGAPFHTDFGVGSMWSGMAMLFLGSPSGPAQTPAWSFYHPEPYAGFGWDVAAAGDVNADGFDDVIVGAYSRTTPGLPGLNHGSVYVFFGSASGLASTAGWMKAGNLDDSFFGHAVAGVGDVNNDGYDDLLVGAYQYDAWETGLVDAGRVFLYLGGAPLPASSPARIVSGTQANAQMGWAVGGLGDINGDGYDDVVMTDYRFDGPEFDEGRVLVYGGTATGLTADPIWSAESNQPEALFADTVTSAGDVNGDGLPDMLLGTQFWDVNQIDEGVASLYLGTCGTADGDGDGVSMAGAAGCLATDMVDCDDGDPALWRRPGALGAITVGHGPGDAALLSWSPPAAPGGTYTLAYDVIRSADPANLVGAASCVESGDVSDTAATDTTLPEANSVLVYVVRAVNGCPLGAGSVGWTSDGTQRLARTCP